MGSTKQAASCPSGVPAPVKVGELGKKRLAGEQLVIFAARRAVTSLPPGFFDLGNVVGHAPEHLLHGFGRACRRRRGARSGVISTWRAFSVRSTWCAASAGRGGVVSKPAAVWYDFDVHRYLLKLPVSGRSRRGWRAGRPAAGRRWHNGCRRSGPALSSRR